jgi:hypothetical protein
MKRNYYTILSNTRFSSGPGIEKKLKIVAAIILVLCLLVLIATGYFDQWRELLSGATLF